MIFEIGQTYSFRIYPLTGDNNREKSQVYAMTITDRKGDDVSMDYVITEDDGFHPEVVGDKGDTCMNKHSMNLWLDSGDWVLVNNNVELPEDLFTL